MPGGRKRILGPFTGCKKRKAWNKTREICMPVKRRQNWADTDRGLEFLDSKGAFYNVNESDNDDESYNENNGQQELPEGFANSHYRIVTPIFYKNWLTILTSASTKGTVAEHLYLLKM